MIKPFEAIAVFYKDEEGYFQVFSPNVEGAISYGETLDEARANIKEAIEGVIETAQNKDIANYFSCDDYKAGKGEIVETIKISGKKSSKAVSFQSLDEISIDTGKFNFDREYLHER
ncbi:MAG: type II toxin-antitoxin system HicB family antitoxin [Candidatus Aminicenantes bacterium]|nr:type II toxin-antitoxin system HicB family antitoxin [Candidatus Aminicenantes bacterium]